jgi:hypothetical protein
MVALSMQSAPCRSNAKSLIIVGVIFGAIWITGLVLQGVAFSAAGSAAKSILEGKSVPSSAGMDAVMFWVGSGLSTIGFLGLIIGMPILGDARKKMACDL